MGTVWVKIKPPGIGPQVLVLGSFTRATHFGVTPCLTRQIFKPIWVRRRFLPGADRSGAGAERALWRLGRQAGAGVSFVQSK